ncbi:MAG: sulfite exporter TauE/SafE family protein [Minisyncoccia bacterium]
MTKKHTLHISGTHCASCKILIEDILLGLDSIDKVDVNIKNETIDIETESEKSLDELESIISEKIKSHGYSVSKEKKVGVKISDNTIWQAIPIGLIVLVLFFWLQKSGILNIGIGGGTTPLTALIIGIIASLSSCLAVVGGLVLSLSAKVAQDDNKSATKTFVLFHLGRIVGFALLGGILGLIGEAFGISFLFSAIIGLLASLIMILLGLNLLEIFKRNKLTLPNNFFNYFRKIEHATWAPIIIGLGTFFLPCGFTQSMQVSALSSGSFISGLLIMLAFSLGTLPVLALISFSSVSFSKSKYAPLFFKSAGVVVLGLGIFALLGGLAGLGIINPLFNI